MIGLWSSSCKENIWGKTLKMQLMLDIPRWRNLLFMFFIYMGRTWLNSTVVCSTVRFITNVTGQWISATTPFTYTPCNLQPATCNATQQSVMIDDEKKHTSMIQAQALLLKLFQKEKVNWKSTKDVDVWATEANSNAISLRFWDGYIHCENIFLRSFGTNGDREKRTNWLEKKPSIRIIWLFLFGGSAVCHLRSNLWQNVSKCSKLCCKKFQGKAERYEGTIRIRGAGLSRSMRAPSSNVFSSILYDEGEHDAKFWVFVNMLLVWSMIYNQMRILNKLFCVTYIIIYFIFNIMICICIVNNRNSSPQVANLILEARFLLIDKTWRKIY